jgi:hypothetical protein
VGFVLSGLVAAGLGVSLLLVARRRAGVPALSEA